MESTAPPDGTPITPETNASQEATLQRKVSIVNKTVKLTKRGSRPVSRHGIYFQERGAILDDGSQLIMTNILDGPNHKKHERVGYQEIEIERQIKDETSGMTVKRYLATCSGAYHGVYEIKKFEITYSKKEVDKQRELQERARTSKIAQLQLIKRIQENTRREQIERHQQEESGKSFVSDKEAEELEKILDGLLQKDESSV